MPLPLPSSTAFWLETILPGFVGTLLAYPLLPTWARFGGGPEGIAGLLMIALILGLSLHILRLPLTEFAMGRFWVGPLRPLRRWLTSRIQRAADRAASSTPATGEFPSSGMLDVLWSRRFLEALSAGSDWKRIACCPTLVGNAYITLALDLGQTAEVAHELRGDKNSAWMAQASIARAWFQMTKESRQDLVEIGATSAALLRLSVIAGVLTIAYVFRAIAPGGILLNDLAFAAGNLLMARLAYSAGFDELLNLISTTRALFMDLDRDTVQILKKILQEKKAGAAVTAGPSPVSKTGDATN